jgi:hypothetical protein
MRAAAWATVRPSPPVPEVPRDVFGASEGMKSSF